MAYQRLGLKDFDTANPFAAKHVEHIEDGIVQNESDITTLNADLTDLDILGMDGTELAIGDDLNDFTDAGKYYTNSAAVSAGVIDSPVTSNAFSMLVVNLQRNGSRKMQIILNAVSPSIFIRGYTPSTNTWTNWNQVQTSSVSTNSISEPYSTFVDENGKEIEG